MKFALFEFADSGEGTDIEVGETKWIEDFDPQEIRNWDPKATVIVFWPNGAAATEPYVARVLAFSDSKQELISKRNRLDKEEDTEDEQDLGRGQRRKFANKLFSDTSEDEADEPQIARPTKKLKNKDQAMRKASTMAKNLREQMSGRKDDDDPQREIKRLKLELQQCKQEKTEMAKCISFVKELPKYMETFRDLVQSAENLAAKLKPTQALDHRRSTTSNDPATKVPRGEQNPSVGVSQRLIDRCNDQDYRKYTSDLLVAVFGRETLATHSLKGGKAFNGTHVRKDALDQEKVEFVISTVQGKFKVDKDRVKLAMTTKLNNESKMLRKRIAVAEN